MSGAIKDITYIAGLAIKSFSCEKLDAISLAIKVEDAHCKEGIVMKNFSSLIFLVSFVSLFNKPSELQAQSSPRQDISGYVIDAATGKPLQAANVFLANTMLGDASNELGHFLIRGVPPGTFEIVVSFIGYEVQKREIRITGPTKPMIFKLTPRPIQAPEIEVTAEDMKKWRKRFKKFKELFFSTTRNASECKILNPYVLDFTEAGGAFKAVADEPIIIENRALGYKLLYVLEDFEDSSDFLKIRGVPKFEELAPASPEEMEKWRKNRLRAYRGSLRHFLATLCKNYDLPASGEDQLKQLEQLEDYDKLKDILAAYKKKLLRTTRIIISLRKPLKEIEYLFKMARVINEGFNVLQFDENPLRQTKEEIVGQLVDTNLYLEAGELPNERWLRFPGYLHVTYTKELEEYNYIDYFYEDRAPNGQQSFFKLTTTEILTDTTKVLIDPAKVLADTAKVLIDTSGHFYNRYGLTVYGYWAWERIADLLPYEYRMNENPKN
jgi:hypothetical protein